MGKIRGGGAAPYRAMSFSSSAVGNVAEAMTAELAEGRSLFVGRVDSRVRDQRDFLVEELLRVARERGMA